MRYEREYMLQSCHFNDGGTYERFKCARETDDPVEAVRLLNGVLPDIHGHNFTVCVVAWREEDDGAQWVVGDVEMTEVVMEWENTNLSVHPDFLEQELRATTETMARRLYEKLTAKFEGVCFIVRVRETPSIEAVYP